MAGHDNTAASDKLVREHAEGWVGFTRFLVISTICVLLVLLMFLLQFFVGWGYAAFFMVLGFIVVAIAAMLGKL